MSHEHLVTFSLAGLGGGVKLAIEAGDKSLLIHHSVYDKNIFMGFYWKQFKTFWIFQTFMMKEIKAEQGSRGGCW